MPLSSQAVYLGLAEEDFVAQWAGLCCAPAKLHPKLFPVECCVEKCHLEGALLLDLYMYRNQHSTVYTFKLQEWQPDNAQLPNCHSLVSHDRNSQISHIVPQQAPPGLDS